MLHIADHYDLKFIKVEFLIPFGDFIIQKEIAAK